MVFGALVILAHSPRVREGARLTPSLNNSECLMVPRAGVEPARPYGQRILSLKSLVTAYMPQLRSVRVC